MTNILGTIAGSTGDLLTGTLTVTLARAITTDSTDPDTLYTTKPKVFAIAAGEVDIDLPETETYQVTYNFTFLETDAEEPLFSINAIVPNVGTTQFATFFPTGITDRNLDTGALRVARLLGRDPSLSQLIKQPAIFSERVVLQETEFKAFVGKPFTGAVLVKTLTVLGISGYELWDFNLGILNSSGNEEVLTPATTSTVTENGRRRILRTYDVSRAASVMGLFMVATPQSGASDLTATISIAFTEV